MPIYEYECNNCEHRLEVIQRFKEEPLIECPECGEEALKRLFGVPGLIFKGPGFYVNDYKKREQGGP